MRWLFIILFLAFQWHDFLTIIDKIINRTLPHQAQESQTVSMREELKKMKRVLRRLGYTSNEGVLGTKGRFSCELSTPDELVLTDMVFDGVFNDLKIEQAVALVSCFVFKEGKTTLSDFYFLFFIFVWWIEFLLSYTTLCSLSTISILSTLSLSLLFLLSPLSLLFPLSTPSLLYTLSSLLSPLSTLRTLSPPSTLSQATRRAGPSGRRCRPL